MNKLLDDYDSIIADLSTQYDNIYVDVKKQFKHIKEYNLTTKAPINLYTDGSHLSKLGNILLAEIVLDAMMSEA